MSASTIIIAAITTIILITFGVFFVGFLIFHNKQMIQNRDEIQSLELEKAKKTLVDAIEIQEAERSRIGSDIHDDLGPTLSAVKLKINNLKSEDPKTQRNITQLKEMVDETIKSVRSLSHSLYPNTLEKYGLHNALTELAQRIDTNELKMNSSITEEVTKLTFYQQINLYRIIQEFCNNSIKYSGCSVITLDISKNTHSYIVDISDNGSGFNRETNEGGLGLKNMKMRAEAINFEAEFTSEIGKGTTLKLTS